MEPIGTVKDVPTTTDDDPNDGDVTAPNSGTSRTALGACSVMDDDLEPLLRQCEVPMPRASEIGSIRDKLDVQLAASPASVKSGGRGEVLLTIHNRTTEPVPLYFTADPVVRFDVEVLDVRGKRADLPSTKWPGYPKGYKAQTREAKAVRILLEKSGTTRLRLPWDAVKTKWAPSAALSWEGRGFPRTAAGFLAPGKYVLRLAMPLLGAVDPPKTPVSVVKL